MAKGKSTLSDGDGNVKLVWTKEGEKQRSAEEIIQVCKAAMKDYTRAAKPVKPLSMSYDDTTTLIPFPDLHVGLLTWEPESGKSWDLAIAEQTINETSDRVLAATPSSQQAVVLFLGDTTHSNDATGTTPKSKHVLDTDGRWQKIFGTTCRIMVSRIDAALLKFGTVLVRVLQGNHDPDAAPAFAYYLSAWYRLDPRVTVDLDPSYWWGKRYGKTLLVATHGDEAPVSQLPMIAAQKWRADWGKSKHTYIHLGHVHRSRVEVDTVGGVRVEQHETIIPKDAWAARKGFLSFSSLKSITYSPETGEIGRVTLTV